MSSKDSRKRRFSKMWPYLAFFLVLGWYNSFKYLASKSDNKPTFVEEMKIEAKEKQLKKID